MPESPELLTSRDIIKPILTNKIIINAYASKTGRYSKKDPVGFQPIRWQFAQIRDVEVRGKFMYWELSSDQFLCSTYGMTGQWSQEETKHTCFSVQYADKIDVSISDTIANSKLIHFNDPRHFGTISFLDRQDFYHKLLSFGWDPLKEDVQKKFDLIKKRTKKTKAIGELMLDQKIFAGCGNYLRAEALYRAKINPWKPGKDLEESELLSLCNHLKDIMLESYQAQGASFQSYVNANGAKGNYSFNFQVYGKKKDPNGADVRRDLMGARNMHWCPSAQPL